MNFLSSLLPAIEHFHMAGYYIAFLAALLETLVGIGLVLPGSTIILFMGALAAQGYFDLGDLLWFAIAGAVIGDNINFYLGRKYGRRILKKGFWFLKPKQFKPGEHFFAAHGSKSVFLGRFLPGLKEVTPLIAGIFGMKRISFLFREIPGAIGWGLVWILPGYFLSQSLDFAKIWLTRAGFLLFVLLVVFILLYLLKIFLIKKGKQFFFLLASLWHSIKQPLVENPDLQAFAKRHKILLNFIKRRLDTRIFYGLPLTLLLLAFIYALGLFGGIAEDIVSSNAVVSADIRIAHLLPLFRNSTLIGVFLWITLLGKWQVIALFTLATLAILWEQRKSAYCVPLLVSVLGSGIFTYISKFAFHRARPDFSYYLEHSFSFPSGHATVAVAFYGFIAYLLIKNTKLWNRKINTLFAWFIIILLIGFSRLYLGVHYASDIWGGYLAGAIWLILGISFSEYLLYHFGVRAIPPRARGKGFMTTAILLGTCGLFVVYGLRYHPLPAGLPATVLPSSVTKITDVFGNEQMEYTETLLGEKQEPLSFIVVADSNQQLVDFFETAGWYMADDLSFSSLIEMTKAAIFGTPYKRAPMTPDFWDAKVHDFGFEKMTALNNVRERHHARFWNTHTTIDGRSIYVGTASFDSGIKWGITHKIKPDIDTEREFLFKDLQGTAKMSDFQKKAFAPPVLGQNFTGDPFFSDGNIYIIELKTS